MVATAACDRTCVVIVSRSSLPLVLVCVLANQRFEPHCGQAVDKLTDRQKLANSLSKANKAGLIKA